MKTKLLFFLLLGSWILAQQQVFSYRNLKLQPNAVLEENTIQTIFSEIDKTKIPTGILKDAAVEFVDLEKFNGSPTDSSYTSARVVKELYNTLIMGRLSETAYFQTTPIDFSSIWYNAQIPNVLPIGGVFYKYARYSDDNLNTFSDSSFQSTNAVKESSSLRLRATDNKVLDKYVNGEWQNPYVTDWALAMAPSHNTFNKLKFQIVLPKEIFLSNNESIIKNVELRLSDNQNYISLPKDKLLDVVYPSEGEYRWTFRVTLNTGEVLYSHSKLKIENTLSSASENFSARNSIPRESYTYKYEIDSYSVEGGFSWASIFKRNKATLYVRLANGRTNITKPFIVAEGFDTGHITAPNREGGDNNINSFLITINNWRVRELENVLLNTYDIIYVDWGKGTDYIQNNAELLKKAIRWVNQNKVGSEKNVVMGQSMGGLVARYALKDMEDKGEDHDTKLYISHDSPHLGANTPIGMQYMSRHISNTYLRTPIAGALEFIVPIFNNGISPNDIMTLSDTPASRQMLINYVGKSYNIDNSAHSNWQTALKEKGFPTKTRNVAISNGNECGTDQNLADLVIFQKEMKNYMFSDVIGVLIGLAAGRPDMSVLAVLPGKSSYVFDIKARPMLTLNDNREIYYGRITYKKRILWAIPAQVSMLKGNMKQPQGVLPIDKYGGGAFRLNENNLPKFFQNAVVSDFSFIPTPSAIAYKNGMQTLTEADYQKTYSPTTDAPYVPFHNFVTETADGNRSHISFSPRNGEFIINQLSNDAVKQNKILSTTNLCGSKIKIGGSDRLCENTTATYTTGFASYINWQITEGADLVNVTSPTNQPQITFTTKSNASGYLTLRVILWEGSATNTSTKRIWIGAPKLSYDPTCSYGGENEGTDCYIICRDMFLHNAAGSFTAYAENLAGVSDWEWEKTKGDFSLDAIGNHAFIQPNQSGNISFRVRAKNNCGWSPWLSYVVSVQNCAASPWQSFQISPNPTSGILNIITKTNETANRNSTIKTSNSVKPVLVEVYDNLGNLKIQKTLKANESSINIQHLPTGTYMVKITKENNTETHQVIKK
ncbi:MAG: T9SS type A sorting domain-containing protein [Cruoricaptor ignavus]|nr:T9SS type A sorting domain-containing protein [Cruoricaptor ignavus]